MSLRQGLSKYDHCQLKSTSYGAPLSLVITKKERVGREQKICNSTFVAAQHVHGWVHDWLLCYMCMYVQHSLLQCSHIVAQCSKYCATAVRK